MNDYKTIYGKIKTWFTRGQGIGSILVYVWVAATQTIMFFNLPKDYIIAFIPLGILGLVMLGAIEDKTKMLSKEYNYLYEKIPFQVEMRDNIRDIKKKLEEV